MIMQSDNSHHEAHQNDLNYSSEYQYDMYMYATTSSLPRKCSTTELSGR